MRNHTLLRHIRRTLHKELIAATSIRALLGKEFVRAINLLAGVRGRVVITGMGKSGHIGQKIASTLISIGIPASYVNAAEAMHGDLGMIGPNDALLAISNSGETKEVLRLWKHIHRLRVPFITITGSRNSSLAKVSDACLVYTMKDEGSPHNLAPMASAVASLIIGDLIATALYYKRGLTVTQLARAHPGGLLGRRLTSVEEVARYDPLPLVQKKDTLRRVLKIMSIGRMGIALVVNDQKRLEGIITDGDIRRFLLTGKAGGSATARDLMTKHPKTIAAQASIQSALQKMEKYKITSLCVTDTKHRLRGVLLMHDVIERELS